MGVGLDAFGSLDETLDLIFGKTDFLDVAKQINGLWQSLACFSII